METHEGQLPRRVEALLQRKELLGKARLADDDGAKVFDDAGSGALPWGLLRRSPESFESDGKSDGPGSADASPERPPGLRSQHLDSSGGGGGGGGAAAAAAAVMLSSSPPLRSTHGSAAYDDDDDDYNVHASSSSASSPSSSSLSQLNSSLASIATITTPLQQLNVLTHELRVLQAQATRDSGAVADLRTKLSLASPPTPSLPTTPSSSTSNLQQQQQQQGLSRNSSGTPVDVVASRENELVAEVAEHVEKLANADVLNQVAILAAQDEVNSSAEALRVALQQRDAQHDLLNVINEQWFTYGSSKTDTPGDHFKRVGEEIKLQNQLREHYHEALSVGTSIASTVSLERATRAAQLSDNLHKYDSEHEQGRMQLKDLRAFEANHKHVLVEQTRELTEAQHRAAALTAELEDSTSSEKNVKSELAQLRRDITTGNKDLEELEATQRDMQTQLVKEKERLAESNAERERAEQDLHAVQSEQRVAEEKLADAKQSVAALASKHQTELDDARDQASEEEALHVREGEERTQELEEVKLAYSKTQTTLEQIELEMRQTQDRLQAELESLGVILDNNDGSLDMASLLRELHGGVLRRIADLEREIRSLERKLATHANASKSFASTIKMQQNRIAHLGEKLARARIQDDWEDNSREMFGTGDADDISVIIDLHDDDSDSGSVVSRASPTQQSSSTFSLEEKEPEEVVVKRLEHVVAHLTADLGTVRRRLDEAKVAATRSLLRTWASNDDVKGCTRCGVAFTWREWRYHCRSCGRIFCSPCTSNRMRTTFHRLPQRSCQECYNDTLRLQKIRELQRRQLAASSAVGAADALELPLEVVNDEAPPCYSYVCRSGTGGNCYSSSCQYASRTVDPKEQRRVNFAKLALRIKEELLQREIKILCISTVSDLYDLTTKFSIPTHRWSELCYFILEGRHESEHMRDAFVEFKACSSSSELDEVRRNLLEARDSNFSGGCRELIRACFYTRLNNIVHAGQ